MARLELGNGHLTNNKLLDAFLFQSHLGEIGRRIDCITEEEVRGVLTDRAMISMVNKRITGESGVGEADFGHLKSQYTAFLGVHMAIAMGIPCLEFDEKWENNPDLAKFDQYVLLCWVEKGDDIEPQQELEAIVHNRDDHNYHIVTPSATRLSMIHGLRPDELHVKPMIPHNHDLVLYSAV